MKKSIIFLLLLFSTTSFADVFLANTVSFDWTEDGGRAKRTAYRVLDDGSVLPVEFPRSVAKLSVLRGNIVTVVDINTQFHNFASEDAIVKGGAYYITDKGTYVKIKLPELVKSIR